MGWHLVIEFDHAYDGEVITRHHGRTRIAMPFANEDSAWAAFTEARMSVERSAPEVIRGEVVADVPAITAGEVIR